jgi:hypothetical protein
MNTNLKFKDMKTQNSLTISEIFNEFILSGEEMSHVRGGEGDPITRPPNPPVVI